MMMRDTNTLHLYPDVIKAMSDVVRKGGFGTSVTPVSQFYFQQAYTNVTQGAWKKINPNYGNMVLGYFGRTPVEPDPDIVKLASEQLGKPVFKDDPLDILEPGIPGATKILEDNNLPVSDENIFIIASCESKGLDFLQGKATTSIRKKSEEQEKVTVSSKAAKPAAGPRSYSITVDGKAYNVSVAEGTLAASPAAAAAPAAVASSAGAGEDINAPTPGNILKIEINVGDTVQKDQTVMIMEAMKMESDIKVPKAGKIVDIFVTVGDTVQASDPLFSIA
jgi:pyruvate carboxylase subunit B